MKKILLLFAFFTSLCASAQVKIGDNPTNVNSNAVFELESTNKGVLFPRVALSSTTSASPLSAFVAGMTVYNTATAGSGTTAVSPGLYYSDGTKWVVVDKAAYTGSTTVTLNGTSFERAALTGDVTAAANTNATTIAANAVNSAKIADGTVVTADLADNAVTSAKIVDATVANADLSTGTGGIYKGSGSLSGNTTVTMAANTLAFASTATTGTSHFTVDGTTLNVDAANNRVGIGTATPSAKLTSEEATINGRALNITGSGIERLFFVPEVGVAGFNGISSSGDTGMFFGNSSGSGVGTATSRGLVIAPWTSGESGLKITEAGNVGIGTTDPISALEIVNNASGNDGKDDFVISTFGSTSPGMAMFKSRGTKSSPANLVNGDSTGGISFGGRWNGTSYIWGPSAINSFYKGNGTTGLTELQFNTSFTSRMTIDEDGNVGIGNTAPNAPLQFSNSLVNRKLVLYEGTNNDHGFYGFGVNPAMLRYQVDATASNHVFFAATSATSSNELMRITGTGKVGIGTSAPTGKLHLSGDSTGSNWNNSSIYSTHTGTGGHTWAFGARPVGTNGDLSISDETDGQIRMILQGGTGNVGIGVGAPTTPLQVGGAVRVGTSTQTAAAAGAGAMRYNSTSGVMEYSNGTSWIQFGSTNYGAYGSIELGDIYGGGSPAAATVYLGYNVASASKPAGNKITVNFSTPMANANYHVSMILKGNYDAVTEPWITSRTTTGFTIQFTEFTGVGQTGTFEFIVFPR
ncbi:hypothetical protein AAEO56_05950 [Flavobacterium sp. DGU11]|uniref:Uncharacterized protein n=1 Tax=Flavobacterium arundinis TaxID=3139143 RepID=A0ABU9HUG3_9FLAO